MLAARHRRLLLLLPLLLLAAGLSVLPAARGTIATGPRAVVERPPARGYAPPADWIPLGDSSESADAGAARVRLVLALKQQRRAAIEPLLYAVSDPTSPQYGRHWTQAEVARYFAPTPAALATTRAWLHEHNVSDAAIEVRAHGAFLATSVTAKTAEAMFGVCLRPFRHRVTGERLMRALEPYTVPAEVAPHVDFVGGLHRFPSYRRALHRAPRASGLGASPDSLRRLYNVSEARGRAGNNSQAVAQFLKQYYGPLDLQEFFALFYPRMFGQRVAKELGPNKLPAGTEASLDIQYVMTMGAFVPTWFWSTGGLHEGQEPFLEWIVNVSDTSNAPWVHSVSYGDDEDSLSVDYMRRINDEFGKLGLRGISILFASGDSGVGGGLGQQCKAFVPDFPASSPFVTAVGGTATLLAHGEVVNGLSGGGFSNVFSRPAYQEAAVQHYLQTAPNLPAPTYYNRTGRAYPDVAALSEGFTVVVDLVPLPGVAGTSCSAPTFAGIVSLVNDLRLQAGKAPLGFLNPFIYQNAPAHPGMLFDVLRGSNPGCGTSGFHATAGWDPCTGYGSPNYALLSVIGQRV